MGKTNELINRFLGEPARNLMHAMYDDYVEANVRFRSKAGVKTFIIRRQVAKCCEWCANLAGIYDYDSAPRDIYRRHDNCKCMVTFRNEKGVYTDVWSKMEFTTQKEARRARIVEIAKAVESGNKNDIINKKLGRIRKPPKPETVTYGTPLRRSVGARSIDDLYVENPFTGEKIEFVPGERPIYPRDHLLAGKGSKKKIKIIDYLLETYGGEWKEWKHEKAYYIAKDEYGYEAYVEIHWFECKGVLGQIDAYAAVRDDEVFFYDIEEWESRWK